LEKAAELKRRAAEDSAIRNAELIKRVKVCAVLVLSNQNELQ
jgi:hypothetical protein